MVLNKKKKMNLQDIPIYYKIKIKLKKFKQDFKYKIKISIKIFRDIKIRQRGYKIRQNRNKMNLYKVNPESKN